MEPNPYEAPSTDQISALARSRDKRIFKAGLKMAAFAFVLPFLAWIVGYGLVALVVIADSSDPVPQGAIAVAFMAFRASLPVAAIIFLLGMGLAWINRRS